VFSEHRGVNSAVVLYSAYKIRYSLYKSKRIILQQAVKDAGRSIGRSGDEGIDGIIKEDKLGLDVIYIQAKRWENVVGRPEIHKFVGALAGQGAKKALR
jgi:restriction system protein